MSLLFSSRCTLELKFAIYPRAASLSSQVSSVDACSIGWTTIDQAPFKHQVNNKWLSPCTQPYF